MRQYRALFISDVHLGTPECKAERLLAFLSSIEAETVYLVGDIIDGWRLLSRWYWPISHGKVLMVLLEMARKCRVVFIPGNHDDFAKRYIGETIFGIHIDRSMEHVAADGNIYLVTHGDEVDTVYTRAPALARVFSWLEGVINDRLGSRLHLWPRLKQFYRLKRHIEVFEEKMLATLTVDGVICGHVHHAIIRRQGMVSYLNCGCWTEDDCTAIAEHFDGTFELLHG